MWPQNSCSEDGGREVEMVAKVWYRSSAGVGIPVYQDRGTLNVEKGTIRFVGKKESVSGRVRSVDRKQLGINRWVHVQYGTNGETRDAYFMDSGLLGWSGVLGGNKRLAKELAAPTPQQG
jgi:hypothetical protein